ncbi:hypothetical protein N9W89_11750 [Hellea sp.]|nr:hypothetical protein [Hellea sp.]
MSGGKINSYLDVAWKIRDNMPLAPSIDNFLDTHSHNKRLVEFGKLAITNSIMKAEQKSLLFVDWRNSVKFDFNSLTNTWLSKFFTILITHRNFESFIEALSNITFISFNYDRCIHQFFSHAAQSYFGLQNEDVLVVLKNLNIIYPYGTIGKFIWSNPSHTNYGEVRFDNDLIQKSKHLRTFTEGTDSETHDLIDACLNSADAVLFMGFGFLDLNMKLLFENKVYPVPTIFATAKGLSKNSIMELNSELGGIFRVKKKLVTAADIFIEDKTCADLIFEHQRFLSK